MATTGVNYVLSDKDKEFAIKYVEDSGLYKSRLSDFLGISRPTLDKTLEENPDFFTLLKRADSVYCKRLIERVSEKNPIFILRTRYKDEFNDTTHTYLDPELEIKRISDLINTRIADYKASSTT